MGIAFCELIEHLPTDGLPKAGATDATLVITIDHQQLMSGLGAAMLTTGTEISAGQARRLACNAHLIPAVLDGDSQILDFGTTRRLFTRTQRTALAVRDQGCIFPGCDRPTHWTEAHHITYAANGGPTNIWTTAACSAPGTTTSSTKAHWSIVMAHDGVPEAIPPPHIDPHQTPQTPRTTPQRYQTTRVTDGPASRGTRPRLLGTPDRGPRPASRRRRPWPG
ncbi:MAG: DUF222 domain-containing protein [Nocardioidaceae bacterium]